MTGGRKLDWCMRNEACRARSQCFLGLQMGRKALTIVVLDAIIGVFV